jgi:hypothetical protein
MTHTPKLNRGNVGREWHPALDNGLAVKLGYFPFQFRVRFRGCGFIGSGLGFLEQLHGKAMLAKVLQLRAVDAIGAKARLTID